MNKYQEALNDICGLAVNHLFSECDDDTEIEERYRKNKDYLQELVDKETPMKVVDKSGSGFCPKCKEELTRYGDCYCGNCGQKLDWSE